MALSPKQLAIRRLERKRDRLLDNAESAFHRRKEVIWTRFHMAVDALEEGTGDAAS